MALSKHDSNLDPRKNSNEDALNENSDRSQLPGEENQDVYTNNSNIRRGQESYLRDAGDIEDLRGTGGDPVEENSSHLTDESGEEKKEEYINTDERKKDIEKNSRNGL